MPATKVKEFLNSRGVKFVRIEHSRAYTAQEVAASAHVSGHDFAKAVMVKLGGELAMVVVPANRRLSLTDLCTILGSIDARLATEREFKDAFPDCEVGAMPPFGNLYGVPVYMDQALTEEPEIAFNAGSHTEIIKMAYADYAECVHPRVIGALTA